MLPGAISYKLFLIWSGKRQIYTYNSFIDIFLFSIADYLLLDVLWRVYARLANKPIPTELSLSALLSESSPINFLAIGGASICGILTAIVMLILIKRNFFPQLGVKLGLSDAVSSDSIWVDFLKNNREWVYVRDYKTNQTYHCYVSMYTPYDNGDFKELYMEDVTVYQDSEELYKLSSLFLIRKADEFSIEIVPKNNSSSESLESNNITT